MCKILSDPGRGRSLARGDRGGDRPAGVEIPVDMGVNVGVKDGDSEGVASELSRDRTVDMVSTRPGGKKFCLEASLA